MKYLKFFLLLVMASPACADEYYEFYKLSCTEFVPAIEIEHVGYWNIGNLIWPSNSWNEHVQSLVKLEAENHLYVFDQLYGHYDQPAISLLCGDLRLAINSIPMERESGSKSQHGLVRMNSTIQAWDHNELKIQNIDITEIERLSLQPGVVDVCTKEGCKRTFHKLVSEIK